MPRDQRPCAFAAADSESCLVRRTAAAPPCGDFACQSALSADCRTRSLGACFHEPLRHRQLASLSELAPACLRVHIGASARDSGSVESGVTVLSLGCARGESRIGAKSRGLTELPAGPRCPPGGPGGPRCGTCLAGWRLGRPTRKLVGHWPVPPCHWPVRPGPGAVPLQWLPWRLGTPGAGEDDLNGTVTEVPPPR